MNHFNNEQVANLPPHLAKYIVDQRYEKYTSVDHAVWRYVMRQNYSFLKDAAYYPYIPGLKMAGLTIEKIPSLQEINDALANIGLRFFNLQPRDARQALRQMRHELVVLLKPCDMVI